MSQLPSLPPTPPEILPQSVSPLSLPGQAPHVESSANLRVPPLITVAPRHGTTTVRRPGPAHQAAPDAIKKLKEKDGDLSRMTMAEMSAIAFKHFKGIALKGNEAAHVKELSALIAQQPTVLQLPAPTPTTDAQQPGALQLTAPQLTTALTPTAVPPMPIIATVVAVLPADS